MNVVYGKHRKAAHGLHRCGYCRQPIGCGELYLDQRCAEGGTMWTWRSHFRCNTFLNTVDGWCDDGVDAWMFADLVADNPELAAELGVA